MGKDTEKTKVIFRASRNQKTNVFAVFPALAGDSNPYRTCLSYALIGQHSACSTDVMSWTRPAKPSEYKSLLEELEFIGYNVQVAKRFSSKDLEARKAQCH